MRLGSYPPSSHSGTLTRFAGSNEVAAAAARHTRSPGAAQRDEGRMRGGPRPKFAGQRDVGAAKQAADEGSRRAAGAGRGKPEEGGRRGAESKAERERRIEAFREDHANLRSKGLSDEAAAAQAERAQETGERPAPSRRYQMLSGR